MVEGSAYSMLPLRGQLAMLFRMLKLLLTLYATNVPRGMALARVLEPTQVLPRLCRQLPNQCNKSR